MAILPVRFDSSASPSCNGRVAPSALKWTERPPVPLTESPTRNRSAMRDTHPCLSDSEAKSVLHTTRHLCLIGRPIGTPAGPRKAGQFIIYC